MRRPWPAGRRRWLLAGAVILAAGGTAAVVAGSGDSAPPAVASATTEALTSGDLLSSSPPKRVEIPALDVSVPVVGLGLRADGAMEAPTDAKKIGWFTGAPTPGSLGPAVLAGHVDYKGAAGVFAELSTLRRGDEIRVTRQDGTTALFTVIRVATYPKKRFPTDHVYGPIDHAGLRLITCGGDFDRRSGHYVDNVVAYARLRDARGPN